MSLFERGPSEKICNLSIDFGEDGVSSDWYALNDDVMGGVSRWVRYAEESIVFDGGINRQQRWLRVIESQQRLRLDFTHVNWPTAPMDTTLQ